MRSLKSRFNIMLVGPKNIGKSTFINTMVESEIAVNTDDLNTYELDINCEGVDKTVVMSESPGLNQIDNTERVTALVNYIKQQFDLYLQEETKISRNTDYKDSRIHCLLYFIKPVVNGLNPCDIEILNKLTKYTNVILVVGKSDALSACELQECKRNVKKQIDENKLPIFNFEIYGHQILMNSENLVENIPFSVIGSHTKTRQYTHKTINIEDKGVCDIMLLREVLLGNYVDFLIDYTAKVLYERYRTEVLNQILDNEV